MPQKRQSKPVDHAKTKHLRRFLVLLSAVIVLFGSVSASFLYFSSVAAQKVLNEQTIRNQELESKIPLAKAAREAQLAAEAAEKARQEASDRIKEQVLTQSADSIDATQCNIAKTHNDPSSIDVLVNKKHCLQPLGFTPELILKSGAQLVPEAANSFEALVSAAQADGMAISVTSSYRSYTDQVNTYRYWVGVSGTDGADTYSARPGYSEHQTGLAVDVSAPGCSLDCFGTTAEYQWMQDHAAEYGFIQRYYKGKESITGYVAEEWHYRYVGVSVAKDMKDKGIQTLEEYWNLPGGDY